ncbi:hypothetical protein Tco_0151392 [Tanacetum coccineum]
MPPPSNATPTTDPPTPSSPSSPPRHHHIHDINIITTILATHHHHHLDSYPTHVTISIRGHDDKILVDKSSCFMSLLKGCLSQASVDTTFRNERLQEKSSLSSLVIDNVTLENERSYINKPEALGWLSKEIHVTWAYLEKKRTRLRLYTKSFEETVHTERGDGVTITK